jgi:glucuronate isomerase
MAERLELHPDRLFPPEGRALEIARELHAAVVDLPILSPHGHTDPRWFADNEPFTDPTSTLLTPDHYLVRMLYSQGVPMESLGVRALDGSTPPVDPRAAWRIFAERFHLFWGTPSGIWLDHVFAEVFGLEHRLSADTADQTFDQISARLAEPAFRPRALLDRFGIEVIATTDTPIDDLGHHQRLADEGYAGRVIPTFRPDVVVDPDHDDFGSSIRTLGELTGRDITDWGDYLAALFDRRKLAISLGATASDHGPPTARTAAIDDVTARRLLQRAVDGSIEPDEAELFRGRMLIEMARMSTQDGLVMQLHAGARRNHNRQVHQRFGRDVGGDMAGPVEYVESLRDLLDEFGNDTRFRIVLFTLDETTFSRELAPLAGHYPSVFLGPPWWFLDTVDAMMRFRRAVTDTAGFANTTGFVDDTRAFFSIPARHDVARRVDCRYLAELVAEHRLTIDQAHRVAVDLVIGRTRHVFNLS